MKIGPVFKNALQRYKLLKAESKESFVLTNNYPFWGSKKNHPNTPVSFANANVLKMILIHFKNEKLFRWTFEKI